MTQAPQGLPSHGCYKKQSHQEYKGKELKQNFSVAGVFAEGEYKLINLQTLAYSPKVVYRNKYNDDISAHLSDRSKEACIYSATVP